MSVTHNLSPRTSAELHAGGPTRSPLIEILRVEGTEVRDHDRASLIQILEIEGAEGRDYISVPLDEVCEYCRLT